MMDVRDGGTWALARDITDEIVHAQGSVIIAIPESSKAKNVFIFIYKLFSHLIGTTNKNKVHITWVSDN